jgi:hypothetical protein
MVKKSAPNQHPQAKKAITGSKNLLIALKGIVGVTGSKARAK